MARIVKYYLRKKIYCIELNSIVDKGINKINDIFISLNVLIVRTIENSALVKLLLTKTYMMNINQ